MKLSKSILFNSGVSTNIITNINKHKKFSNLNYHQINNTQKTFQQIFRHSLLSKYTHNITYFEGCYKQKSKYYFYDVSTTSSFGHITLTNRNFKSPYDILRLNEWLKFVNGEFYNKKYTTNNTILHIYLKNTIQIVVFTLIPTYWYITH